MRWVLIAAGPNGCDCTVGLIEGSAEEVVGWFLGVCKKHGIEPTQRRNSKNEPKTIRFNSSSDFCFNSGLARELCNFGEVRGDYSYSYILKQVSDDPGYQKIGKFSS